MLAFFRSLFLNFILFWCTGAPPQLDGRIVGGFEVNIEQVPWQVSLLNRGSQHCKFFFQFRRCVFDSNLISLSTLNIPLFLSTRRWFNNFSIMDSNRCPLYIVSVSRVFSSHIEYQLKSSVSKRSRKTVRELSVRAGSSKYNRNGQLYDIKRIVQHPLYNRGITDYDYSLLELTQRIQFDQTKQAIPLSNANERASTGTSCLVTGILNIAIYYS